MPPVSPAYEDAAMPGYRDNAVAKDVSPPMIAPARAASAEM
jgi:hypothetical protein